MSRYHKFKSTRYDQDNYKSLCELFCQHDGYLCARAETRLRIKRDVPLPQTISFSKSTMKVFCALGLLFLVYNGALGAKILGVFPMVSHSHYTLGLSLMKELAFRGHEVTFISPYPQKTPLKNFRDVSVEDIIEQVKGMSLCIYLI